MTVSQICRASTQATFIAEWRQFYCISYSLFKFQLLFLFILWVLFAENVVIINMENDT